MKEKLPVCKECSTRWTWKQTMKRTMKIDTDATCPSCGKMQYTKEKYPWLLAGFLLFLLMLIFIGNLPLFPLLLSYVVLTIGFLCTVPFHTELRSSDPALERNLFS
ncbi:TIGR04104 family putative zinc finger protein [Alkalicoccus chagannorensis]|uniref:TIGR04104 family putative zinc finger protein n=1 Tax=Alkalicoccus chagannorensis TaxID=427072 RepID=UPI0003FEA95F|nr:TIGR04104 family putative zinc finger protein [Alkalicoccus chagannorensis]